MLRILQCRRLMGSGVKIARSSREPKKESSQEEGGRQDSFLFNVDNKEIAGEYLIPEDKKGTLPWIELTGKRDALENEEDDIPLSYGTVRLDSDNRPKYHGQFNPDNPRLEVDVNEMANKMEAKLRLPDEEDESTPAPTPVIKEEVKVYPPKEKPVYEELDLTDFFPERKNFNQKEYPKVGHFNFIFTPQWEKDCLYNQETRDEQDKNFRFQMKRRAFLGENEEMSSVFDGLELNKNSPLRSPEEVTKELDQMGQSFEQQDDQRNDEEMEEEEENGPKLEVEPPVEPKGEEPNVEDTRPKTAYEYVQKLRKGEIEPETDELKKLYKKYDMANPSGSAMDSQGFNSFKNYVFDLTTIRNSELVWMLKSRVLYCTPDVIAINKPYGLVIEGGKRESAPILTGILDELQQLLIKERVMRSVINGEETKLRTVHRLDKDATGVLLLATTSSSAAKIHEYFRDRMIEKTYYAITKSLPTHQTGIIDIPIESGSIQGKERMVLRPELREELRRIVSASKQAKRAVTNYNVLSYKGNSGLLQVKPQTGVKHQIRVHLGFGLRTPILGDHKYSHLDSLNPQKLAADQLMALNVRQAKVRNIPLHLHCRKVMIPPLTPEGSPIIVDAPIPGFFRETMKRLKLFIPKK